MTGGQRSALPDNQIRRAGGSLLTLATSCSRAFSENKHAWRVPASPRDLDDRVCFCCWPRCRIFDTVVAAFRGSRARPAKVRAALHICRLRLRPASGISALNGDVAEWLKAAVC